MDFYEQRTRRGNLWSYLLVGLVGALIGGLIMVGAYMVIPLPQESPQAEGENHNDDFIPEEEPQRPPLADDYSGIIVTVAEQVTPSVVGITNFGRVKNFFGRSALTPQATGSGVIIDSNQGYIVTNNHVVEGAAAVSVTLGDGNEVDAEIVGTDSYSDLAVLKIDPQGLSLQEVPWGDSDKVRVGEIAIAIGNPLGLQFKQSVTTGIVSAINREVVIDDSIFTYIQTDAAINQGNSGGPLVNSSGQLIGINSAKIGATGVEGMGFAIPSNTVRQVVDDLIEFGYVPRPWLGIYIRDNINSLKAEYYGLAVDYGVLVGDVEPGAPAHQVGIKAGDIIIAINGERIENHYQLQKVLYQKSIGDQIKVTVQRGDKKVDFDVTLAQIPEELS